MLVSVLVGYTTSRPVIPDEHHTLIVQDCTSETEACLLAAQWVASKEWIVREGNREVTRRVEMPTSTKVLAIAP